METKKLTQNTITEGPVWKGLLSFFFPILFGTFFQQFYNTADAIIVGQFAGKESLAAVAGGTAIFTQLIVGFFVGLSSGAGVVVSQFYGANNDKEVSASCHTALLMAFFSGIVLTVVGYFSTPFAMRLIETPEDFFDKSVTYLEIYFMGMTPMFIYNMASGIFRAIGDSKTPLYVLIACCVANVVFDLIFVVVLKLDVAGAAWATVLCQVFSMILILWNLARLKNAATFRWSKLKFSTPIARAHFFYLLKKMIQIGVPTGLQSTFYMISNLIIQADINSFGTITAAAWAAYGRIEPIYWLTISAFGIALTTFSGQNFGAGKIERIHEGTKTGMIFGCVGSLVVTAFFWFCIRYLFMLFTNDEEVIETGVKMGRFLCPFFITYIPVEFLSAVIRGTGETLMPTITTCFGVCILRLIWLLFIFPLNRTFYMAFASYPITWIITALVFIIYYRFGNWMKK